jgi:hypothetical protein
VTDRRCNATVDGKLRCTFKGSQDELVEHAQFAGHPLCIVCARSLTADETRTCDKCVRRARNDLSAIIDGAAQLPAAIENAGWRGGYAIEALTLYADGAVESSVQQMHPGEYDLDAEWPNDPIPVVALLESWDRMWRLEFGHSMGEDLATVVGCAGYLLTWLSLAARTFDGFDDFADEIHQLRVHVERATGDGDPTLRGVRCLDCNARLTRVYRSLSAPLPHKSRSADGRRGLEAEGRTDTFVCPSCHRDYDWRDYGRAIHRLAASVGGWVPVSLAAEVVRRPVKSVRNWVNDLTVTSACRVSDRRVVVVLDELRTVSASCDTRQRGSAA